MAFFDPLQINLSMIYLKMIIFLRHHMKKGMEYFNQATNVDPDFALAYAGIADSYHLLSSYGLLEPKIAFIRAKEAAVRAIYLDHNLAEAYNSLAGSICCMTGIGMRQRKIF